SYFTNRPSVDSCPTCGRSPADVRRDSISSRDAIYVDYLEFLNDVMPPLEPSSSSIQFGAFTLDRFSGTLDFPIQVITSIEGLREVVEALESATLIAIDTETTGTDPFLDDLLLVQIAVPSKVYVIDVRAVKDLSILQPSLRNQSSVKLLQNAKFDYQFL